jgi:tungstate transport system substrate-binding protein
MRSVTLSVMAHDLTLRLRTPHSALRIVLLALLTLGAVPPQRPEVLLATTTSTRDAGLLDSLLPIFARRSGFKVKVVAVGSGQALEMGRRGDADVVLAHAPEAERVLTDSGYFVRRRLVMHNDFLVVGPAADPAAVRGMTDAVAAFRRLAAGRAPFVSRGDRSGTHLLELGLWRLASPPDPLSRAPSPPDPLSRSGEGGRGPPWYIESGQGMAATLQMADQKRAYAITDRATYLAWRDKVQLLPLVEGDPLLYNVYHVMEVNPRNAPRVNVAGGRALADFLVTPEAQAFIAEFGMSRFGQSLFVPDAGKLDRW